MNEIYYEYGMITSIKKVWQLIWQWDMSSRLYDPNYDTKKWILSYMTIRMTLDMIEALYVTNACYMGYTDFVVRYALQANCSYKLHGLWKPQE